MMNVCLVVGVLIVFCFVETLVWAKEAEINEQERFSKVRYLITQPENEAKTSRPFFHWESAPITTPSSENAQFVVTFPIFLSNTSTNSNNHSLDNRKESKPKLRKTKKKKASINKTFTENLSSPKNSTKIIKNHKRRHKEKRKRKKKQRKKRRKNKNDSESSVLEIPKMAKNITNVSTWNIKTDLSIQDVISKLNSNPETSYKNLLGKSVSEDEVKISHSKSLSGSINVSSPSLPNRNVFGINSDDYKNDTRILLEQKTSNKTAALEFYEPSILDRTAPTITESIYKNSFKESQDKISNRRNYNGPKINYSELMKPSKEFLLNNNTIVMQTNEIRESLGNSFDSSEKGPRYRKFRCNLNNGGCAHICSEINYQKCSCLEGFALGTDGRSCFDINECSKNNGVCESLCYNILGSYYCSCPSGLRIGDDLKSCEDINECLLRNGHGPCQDICTNTFGSYFCGCSDLNGTRLAEDKHTCEDVNECKEGRSGCSHGCINTHGRAFCTCPNGMELGSNWKTCYDINECEDEKNQKQCKYGCLNTVGSYHCLSLNNEQNDQIPAAPEHISCPPMFPPKHGFFHCSRKKAVLGGFKTKTGRMRITNRPGTFCELVCPAGFKNVGEFRVFCGFDGKWSGKRKGKCSPFPKPKIRCPGPLSVQLIPGEKITQVRFPPPKANVDWRYVESEPVSAKQLEVYLPQGHHWITFKATDHHTQLSAKCIIYIVVKKTKM